MQCPKCHAKNFDPDGPCRECGFHGDAEQLAELEHLHWLLGQMDEWDTFDLDANSAAKLKKIYTSRYKDVQVDLRLRLPAFTSEEVETVKKAWFELTHLETLFEKVEEWRAAGYFNPEMDGQDPVRSLRAHAEVLRQRLDEYERPASRYTDPDRLKTVSFLLDHIDLLASRGWFKSKREIEKAVAPIMEVMIDVMSDGQVE